MHVSDFTVQLKQTSWPSLVYVLVHFSSLIFFFSVAFQTFLLANALELENVSETFFTDEQNNYTRKKPYLSAQYIWIASNFLTQVAVKVSNIFTTIRREQTTPKT